MYNNTAVIVTYYGRFFNENLYCLTMSILSDKLLKNKLGGNKIIMESDDSDCTDRKLLFMLIGCALLHMLL